MGILDRLGLGKRAYDAFSIDLGASPFSSVSLSPVVMGDIAAMIDPSEPLPLSRAQAIRIPAVSKARNLLVSTIGRFPLRAIRSGVALDSKSQPTFLYRTNSNVTPYERMAWTVDDLFFHGYAVWLVERGEVVDGRRPILQAEWCSLSRVTITNGNILIDEQPVDESEIILFNSPFEGMLTVAAATMRGARDQEAAWIGRARNPIPLIELHVTDDSELSQDEIKQFVDAWSKARRSENGAIGATPKGLEIRVHGTVAADLMVEGRNAVRTDVGSFANIRASMLDGTSGIDSLTYTTKDGERNLFYEIDLPFWTDPIEARLSMDDVVPRGQYIRFDKYEAFNPPAPTGPTVED